MVLVRSERGSTYLERAIADGILEPRDPAEEKRALDLLVRLAAKQRARVSPDDPHALTAYASSQALEAARQEDKTVHAH